MHEQVDHALRTRRNNFRWLCARSDQLAESQRAQRDAARAEELSASWRDVDTHVNGLIYFDWISNIALSIDKSQSISC